MVIKIINTVIFSFLGMSVVMATPVENLNFNDRVIKIVRKYFPKAEITSDNDKFDAKHGTMIFTVHTRWKTGEVGNKTNQVEGPNYLGFILSVSIQDNKYKGSADVPQTLRRPYWHTYIDRFACNDGKNHYVINFSYGSRLDKEFVKSIFEALTTLKSEQVEAPQKDLKEFLLGERRLLEGINSWSFKADGTYSTAALTGRKSWSMTGTWSEQEDGSILLEGIETNEFEPGRVYPPYKKAYDGMFMIDQVTGKKTDVQFRTDEE